MRVERFEANASSNASSAYVIYVYMPAPKLIPMNPRSTETDDILSSYGTCSSLVASVRLPCSWSASASLSAGDQLEPIKMRGK